MGGAFRFNEFDYLLMKMSQKDILHFMESEIYYFQDELINNNQNNQANLISDPILLFNFILRTIIED